jgi:hypothetical protein
LATDLATEAETDLLTEHPRVDVVAAELRMGTNDLCAHLRNQGIWLNPGDRVPWPVASAALEAELAAGRPWEVVRVERIR